MIAALRNRIFPWTVTGENQVCRRKEMPLATRMSDLIPYSSATTGN
jgi:hypothetical protein